VHKVKCSSIGVFFLPHLSWGPAKRPEKEVSSYHYWSWLTIILPPFPTTRLIIVSQTKAGLLALNKQRKEEVYRHKKKKVRKGNRKGDGERSEGIAPLFLTSGLDRGEWPTSWPGRFTLGNSPQCPMDRKKGGPQSLPIILDILL
jgi:hypothetical protein